MQPCAPQHTSTLTTQPLVHTPPSPRPTQLSESTTSSRLCPLSRPAPIVHLLLTPLPSPSPPRAPLLRAGSQEPAPHTQVMGIVLRKEALDAHGVGALGQRTLRVLSILGLPSARGKTGSRPMRPTFWEKTQMTPKKGHNKTTTGCPTSLEGNARDGVQGRGCRASPRCDSQTVEPRMTRKPARHPQLVMAPHPTEG